MSLREQAMLITLSVSCWTNSIKDRKVSAEVERTHNARDAGRYNKTLVDKTYVDPLTSFAGQIRAFHYTMTLPWGNNGDRLLPAKLFMEYSAQLRKLTSQYDDLVTDFLKVYDTRLIQDARNRLGSMYNPEDYPPSAELRQKFGVRTDITPLSEGSDFRVDVSDAERDRIRGEIDAKLAERQTKAQEDAWLRVKEAVSAVETRMLEEKPVFRDTLITNVEEITKLLPGLNITNDPQVGEVCKVITQELIVNPSRLRSSPSLRRSIREAASKVLQMIPA